MDILTPSEAEVRIITYVREPETGKVFRCVETVIPLEVLEDCIDPLGEIKRYLQKHADKIKRLRADAKPRKILP